MGTTFYLFEGDIVVTIDNMADEISVVGEECLGGGDLDGGEDDDHADAHVEGVVHVMFVDLAELLDEGEEGGDGPAAFVDSDAGSGWQDAGDIVPEAATGNVSEATDVDVGVAEGLDFIEVTAVDGEHRFARGCVEVGVGGVPVEVAEGAAGEGVAVGVEASGGESENGVARLDAGAIEELAFVDDTHDGADNVDFAGFVDAGHFGGFTAEKGTAYLLAGGSHAVDDGGDLFGFKFGGGDVIEEEEGGGPLNEDVIDAMVNEILADGIPAVHVGGDFGFGADTVGGGDEDGVVELFEVGDIEEAAEVAGIGEDGGGVGGANGRFHQFSCFLTGGDIDTSLSIGGLVGHKVPLFYID